MPMLIDAFGAKHLGVEPLSKITGKEEQEITLRSPAGTQAVINFAAHGSGTATPGLVDGKAVIGMASRALNDAETKFIDERFKVPIRAAGNEHVLALDGIAVIVHPDNGVKQLTLEQIAKIFSGQIANWKDVGGAERPDPRAPPQQRFRHLRHLQHSRSLPAQAQDDVRGGAIRIERDAVERRLQGRRTRSALSRFPTSTRTMR